MGSGADTRDVFESLHRAATQFLGSELTEAGVISPEEWDGFVADTGGGLAQTWDWGELKRQASWEPSRVGLRDHGRLVGGAQILVRRIGGLGSIGYLDGGPLAATNHPSLGDGLMDLIEATCHSTQIRALIVDPLEDGAIDRSTFDAAGYVTSQVKTSLGATVRVDLEQPEQELMAAMKSKTRYNVRKGLRSGVDVRAGESSDVATFHELMVSTAERQGFVPMSEDYLTELWERFAPSDRVSIFLASVEGETVAGILITVSGDTAIYKRGAWNGRHGNSHPNEVLHWEAMKWARQRGLHWYDFDGIERNVAETLVTGKDVGDLESVTRFKLGFGGDAVLLPLSLTLVPNRLLRAGYRHVLPPLLRIRRVKNLVKELRSR